MSVLDGVFVYGFASLWRPLNCEFVSIILELVILVDFFLLYM